jgi:hypothetical protein
MPHYGLPRLSKPRQASNLRREVDLLLPNYKPKIGSDELGGYLQEVEIEYELV